MLRVVERSDLSEDGNRVLLASRFGVLRHLNLGSPIAEGVYVYGVRQFSFRQFLTLLVTRLRSRFLSTGKGVGRLSTETITRTFLERVSFTDPFRYDDPESFPCLLNGDCEA